MRSPVLAFSEIYDSDPRTQGLALSIGKGNITWTFSFMADPKMKEYFITKYKLEPLQTDKINPDSS